MHGGYIRKFILCILLLLALTAAGARAEGFPRLSVGSRGEEVLSVKQRLYALGYYQRDSFTRQYTEDTAAKISLFQRANGLPETGEVDAATAEALFSPDAARAPRPTMRPLATPPPTPVPDWPERDEDGYLAGEGEYYYENPQEGLWIYLSARLQITVRRLEDAKIKLRWFETDILTRDGEELRAKIVDGALRGRGFQNPGALARQAGFVLAFSDDFFANRVNTKETLGVIIRGGKLLSEKTNAKRGHHLPNLDMMAQYPDGTLAVYRCNEISGAELLAQGAVNVFSFGPILIRDGEIEEMVYDYYKSLEPRHALGMIAPGHYFLLSVQGRTKASEGTTLQRVAEMLRAHGVTQALNLDGGNTMALVFHGEILNEFAVYNGKKFIRTVPSLIGVGQTAY